VLERLYSQKQNKVMVSLCDERELNQNSSCLRPEGTLTFVRKFPLSVKTRKISFFFPVKVRALDGIHIYNIIS
jgi:hypothetical protein